MHISCHVQSETATNWQRFEHLHSNRFDMTFERLSTDMCMVNWVNQSEFRTKLLDVRENTSLCSQGNLNRRIIGESLVDIGCGLCMWSLKYRMKFDTFRAVCNHSLFHQPIMIMAHKERQRLREIFWTEKKKNQKWGKNRLKNDAWFCHGLMRILTLTPDRHANAGEKILISFVWIHSVTSYNSIQLGIVDWLYRRIYVSSHDIRQWAEQLDVDVYSNAEIMKTLSEIISKYERKMMC